MTTAYGTPPATTGVRPEAFLWVGFFVGLPGAVLTTVAMTTDHTLGLVVLVAVSLLTGIPLTIGLLAKAVEVGVRAARERT